MPTSTTCPDTTTLIGLMRHELADQVADVVADHLRDCPICAETVRNLSVSDTLADALRNRQEDEIDAADTARVNDLIERLRSIRPNPVTPESERTTAAEYHNLAPAQQPDEIGRLGPYRVLGLLGAGGMGIVFEAEDTTLGRQVALKVMSPALALNEADRRRFLREARAVAAIEHDHIVPIYQVGEDRGIPFLAMQLLRGESLETCLARRHRLSVPEALLIAREIATGLAAAHARALIHRDIKPANIWLETRHSDPRGNLPRDRVDGPDDSLRVKILDFGLARMQTDESGVSRTTGLAGTPAYMAPEQARGQPVDGRTDLFSLGCVLYRMLTGQLPFQGVNSFAVLVEVTGRNQKPPRLLNEEIPLALDSLVMKLLEKNPAQRSPSAADVVAELKKIETSSDALGERGNSRPPAGTRRMISLVAAVAVVAFAMIAYFAGALIFRVKTPHGTIVLEMDSPAVDGASVFVDEQLKVTVRLDGEGEPVTINADPGTHKLKVAKAGFEVFTREFSLKAGKREWIQVHLEPAGEKTNAADVASGSGSTTSPKSATKSAPPIASAGPNAEAIIPGLVAQPIAVPGFRRWQLDTRLPRGEVFALAWAPDGRRIACGSPIGNVRVLDADTSELLQIIPAHKGMVWSIDWSREGDRIVSAGDDGVVQMYDASGGPLRELDRHANLARTIALSPDASWVASAGWDSMVQLCRTAGEVGPRLTGHAVQIDALAWSPNGGRLASASWDGTVRLWDLKGSPGPVLKGHEGGVLALAWSPDGELLASAGFDGTIRLWSSDGTERSVFRGHAGCVAALAWSTGDVLASGGWDGTVRLWQRDGTPVKTCALNQGRIHVLAWTRDGRRLAVAAGDPPVRFLDPTGEPAGALSYDTAPVRSIVWNRSGQLATAGDDSTVRVWNEDGTQKSLFPGHGKKRAYRVSWNPTGNRLVSGGGDETIRVWDLTGETVETRVGYNPVQWNPAGEEIAWGIGWEVRMAAPGANVNVLRGHKSNVIWLAWNANGTQLASSDYLGEIHLWNRDGSAGPVMQSTPTVLGLAWHPQRPLLAVGAAGSRNLQFWHTDGKLAKSWEANTKGFVALAWSPDGERLLASGFDQTVRFWTVDGKPVGALPGAMATAFSADWDASGRRIATSHTDGMIRTWDGDSYEPQWTSLLLRDGGWVRFGPTSGMTASDKSAADRLFVVVAEDDLGHLHQLTPSQFAPLHD